MKTIFFILLMMTSLSQATTPDLELCDETALPEFELPNEFDQLGNVTATEKRNFVARTMYPGGGSWPLSLRIETNFKVPFLGSQTYFGKIYFKRGENRILYRDELLASDHYKEESTNPHLYHISAFTYASMNTPKGSEVATGVRLIGQNLNSNSGGRLTISVKPPGGTRMNIPMDIQVRGNNVVASLNAQGRRIVFDQIKINARNGSILSGVENFQFFQNGRLVYTMVNGQ